MNIQAEPLEVNIVLLSAAVMSLREFLSPDQQKQFDEKIAASKQAIIKSYDIKDDSTLKLFDSYLKPNNPEIPSE